MESLTIAAAPAREDLEARFAAFVETHRERTVRLAWRLVGGDDAAAEDVAQEAFVRAYRALGRFREESSLSTWLYRIVVRQAHSHRRWRAVRDRWHGEYADELRDPRPEPDGDPALRQRIARSLDQLSRPQREAFTLVHLEGFTVRETAGIMGRSEGAVKSPLHRALRTLRAKLADLHAPASPKGSSR